MQPVRDQGQEGAVVGFAIAAALEYQIRKTLGETVTISPRYIYYYAREKEGTVSSDSGAQLRDGVSVAATRGTVPESAWPYRPGEFAMAPPTSVANARHYKITKYLALNNLNAVKSALATTGPVVIGLTIYQGFEGADVAKSGQIQMPKANEQVVGGFAVCLVGYDGAKRLFKFRSILGVIKVTGICHTITSSNSPRIGGLSSCSALRAADRVARTSESAVRVRPSAVTQHSREEGVLTR